METRLKLYIQKRIRRRLAEGLSEQEIYEQTKALTDYRRELKELIQQISKFPFAIC
jgi:hypothetical protein